MATKAKDDAYYADDVQHLAGREAVQAKTSMYIGSTDDVGLYTCVREPVDNIYDEALSGHCAAGGLVSCGDNEYWVVDSGRGMPVGMMEVSSNLDSGTKEKVSALRALTSVLHAGGKMSKDATAYKNSRGAHGIGQKATNFLSHFFEVWTFSSPTPGNPKSWHRISYKDGVLDQDVHKTSAPVNPINGKAATKGTVIHFKLNTKFFTHKTFDVKMLLSYLRLSSYFTPGFKFYYLDEVRGDKKVIHSENGLADYIDNYLKDFEGVSLLSSQEGIISQTDLADVGLVFTDLDGCHVRAFTNGLQNAEGGTHLDSTFKALKAALEPYQKKSAKSGDKAETFTLSELKEGLVGLVSVKLSSPQFTSQVKTKLNDERAGKALTEILLKEFTAYFKANKKVAELICERATKLRGLKNKFLASKKAIAQIKGLTRKGPPAKALTALDCTPAKRELFLIEGDSAKGSCIDARDSRTQEIYPLRGKIMNAFRAKPDKFLASPEILGILAMLGYNPKAADPCASLRVGKVILMSDADDDGCHINALELSTIKKYLPDIIARGMLYIVDLPEYVYEIGPDKYISASSKQEMLANMKAAGLEKKAFTHLKGLGEMPAYMLKYFGMDPRTRRLRRIVPSARTDGDAGIVEIMAGESGIRKQLLGI